MNHLPNRILTVFVELLSDAHVEPGSWEVLVFLLPGRLIDGTPPHCAV